MSKDQWSSPWNPFNSHKVLLWRQHLEACAKDEYLIPVTVDIDLSNHCNMRCEFCVEENEVVVKLYGKNIKIKDINVGDKLVGYDEINKKLDMTTVTEVFKRVTSDILQITLDDGKILKVTKEHPFFINNNWICAKDLNINDRVLVISNSDKRSLRMKNDNPMYNQLTVTKTQKTKRQKHTYEKMSRDFKGRKVSNASIIKGIKTYYDNESDKKQSLKMMLHNPMHNNETAKKVGRTLKRRYQLGLIIKPPLTQKHKDALVKRMTNDNPMFNEEYKLKRLSNIDYSEVLAKTFTTCAKKKISLLQIKVLQLFNDNNIKNVYHNKNAKYTFTILNGTKKRRIPDFCVFDCNKNVVGVIEVGIVNCPHVSWNKDKFILKNMKHEYSNLGLEFLFISNEDLNDSEKCFNKMLSFLKKIPNCIHFSKIVSIDKLSAVFSVHNLSCTPFNNFFVNNVLVHNCNAYDITSSGKKDLPTSHWVNLANFIKSWGSDRPEGNPRSACVAGGGESLMHPGAMTFLEAMHKNSLEVGLITNGSLLTHEKIEIIAKTCRWVGFSIDAATYETFNKIKYEGVVKDDGVFRKVCENVKSLTKLVAQLELKNDIAFKFLLSPKNYHEIYDAAVLAKSLGVRDFHLRPVGYLNVTKTKDRTVIYTPEMLQSINTQLEEALKLEDFHFHVYGVRHKFNADFSVKKNFTRCWAIPILPTFAADGNVYMCFDMRGRQNTIMCRHYPDVTEISRFWNSEQHKNLVKNYDITTCPRCTFTAYNEIVENVIIQDKFCRNFP